MKIVITGASGFIGSELAAHFYARGDQVIGISRRESRSAAWHTFFQTSLGQSCDPAAFQNADLVIHTAHDRTKGACQTNVSGTKLWFDQARRAGAHLQLFLSSVAAHREAPSEYGRAKFILEEYFFKEGGLVIRPGLVVGHGGTFMEMLHFLTRFPVVPIPGGDRLKVVLTDITTLSEVALKHSFLKKRAIYNLFQPEWIGLYSLGREIRRLFKVRGFLLPLPIALSKFMIKMAEKVWLPQTLSYESLCNTEKSQYYGYVSSYPELGLPIKTLTEMLKTYNDKNREES